VAAMATNNFEGLGDGVLITGKVSFRGVLNLWEM
jgi:hypothetical protein